MFLYDTEVFFSLVKFELKVFIISFFSRREAPEVSVSWRNW